MNKLADANAKSSKVEEPDRCFSLEFGKEEAEKSQALERNGRVIFTNDDFSVTYTSMKPVDLFLLYSLQRQGKQTYNFKLFPLGMNM